MSEVDVTALPIPRSGSGTALTIGVEEEFLLVDEVTGELVPLGPQVLSGPPDQGLDLQPEMTQYQVESATAVCRTASEVREQLLAARAALARRAAAHGARLVASGAPVLGGEHPPPLTDHPRYRRIMERYGALVDGLTICGCHVHVGIPSPSEGLVISNHLRRWLPVLLALSANSPFHEGRDTGYASWRHVVWNPWPSAGPPPWFDSVEDYRLATHLLRTSGAALDDGMVYWDVRLSANHPTVELRVCDVAATVEEAVVLAALVRAIAATALSGEAAPRVSDRLLRVALWQAARHGPEGAAVDPLSGVPVPFAEEVGGLLRWCGAALDAAGDTELVVEGVARLLRDGGGAARQRKAYRRRGEFTDVVELLTTRT
ncbi:glutamate--cysteine ligase [Actinosynnema pretiosum subsp. pretiosum]|uniref:Putative glutamate--cysteine ligase 2 n=1 Tax=Actinosynnema pretiosum subsp. pretiosum TaxID=103721 RepID=A0AA45L592_9PSEU|nr:hypothetical protein APASM_5195 [Actinosynnema pretiosum subsp. pretiosum]QUF03537.1 glutamate--cysteine ligase [Actinosynnema pretiosum subsp. pretiosum]